IEAVLLVVAAFLGDEQRPGSAAARREVDRDFLERLRRNSKTACNQRGEDDARSHGRSVYPTPRLGIDRKADMLSMMRTLLVFFTGALAFAQVSKIQTPNDLFQRNVGTKEQQGKAFPPHKIAGNLYYVGSETLASFLIVTPQGNILINSDYEVTVPL